VSWTVVSADHVEELRAAPPRSWTVERSGLRVGWLLPDSANVSAATKAWLQLGAHGLNVSTVILSGGMAKFAHSNGQ